MSQSIKETKSNTKSIKHTKTIVSEPCKWLEDYRDYVSWEMKPLTNNLMKQICIDIVQWCKRDDVLTIDGFFLSKNMDPNFGYQWSQKYPDFKEAFTFAKRMIAFRRENKSLVREVDSAFAEKMMPYYNQDWKDMAEWRAQLKAKADAEQNQKANVIVLAELDYKKKIEDGKL